MKNYANTVHVDSMLTALPLFIYPVYLLLIFLLALYFSQSWWSLLTLLLIPFSGWAYIQLKEQLDKPLN